MFAARLPLGVRDYLPKAAAERRTIVDALVRTFEQHGYARVITPSFEYEEVFERGGTDPKEMIRFVEPTSARVAVLRTDFTPQIARLSASQMRDAARPLRLCYEGIVLRLPRGVEPQRELAQTGVELIGRTAPKGDVEVVRLCAEALSAAGASALHLDMGHVGLVARALKNVPLEQRGRVRALLGRKAVPALGALPLPIAARKQLVGLACLHGGRDVLAQARRLGAHEKRVVREIEAVVDCLPAELQQHTTFDLGELRGFGYYTGVCFAFLVRGVSEPLARGGRYDNLLAGFGCPEPATGFAVDVELVARSQKSKRIPDRG